MQINSVLLKGFRNFRDTTVIFNEKTLVIGSNDIGKTNLLDALRILLDKSLSDSDLEPKKTDFYAFESTSELTIRIQFSQINEDCIIAKLREFISDSGTLELEYKARIDPVTKKMSYQIFIGKDIDSMVGVESRFYLRVMNLRYIGSRRDLISFIRQEKQRLLEEAKQNREQKEIEEDTILLGEIEAGLNDVNEKITSLSYVQSSTTNINSQLGDLSYHNQIQNVVFDVGASDPSEFVKALNLSSRINGRSVAIGGDGRNNQIHLALWSTRNKMQRDSNKDLLEVSFFCIEEPEAHLHPHQQRKLAKYLSTSIEGQVVITSHSPQIACEFPPTSLVRLYTDGQGTLAAGNSINPFVEKDFIEFGYRLNIMAAEVFFADLVYLVEGPSEELLYKALATSIGIDLDKYNISILMVGGIGFKPYASLLSSLRIPFVMRTDNDIIKVPKREKYRLAGIQRAVSIFRMIYPDDDEMNDLCHDIEQLSNFDTPEPTAEIVDYVLILRSKLQQKGIFLSDIDLEHDIYNSIPEVISTYLGIEGEDVIPVMQKNKATFMFDFISSNNKALDLLKETSLALPLHRCQSIAESLYGL